MPYAIDDEEKEKRTSTDLRDLDLIPCAVTRRRILNHNSKETFSCELPYNYFQYSNNASLDFFFQSS